MTMSRRESGLLAVGAMWLIVLGPSSVLAQSQKEPPREQTKQAKQETPPTSSKGGQADSTQPPATGKPASKPYDLRTTSQLTGDWGGVRTELQDSGISLKLTSQTQFMVNMHGGLETENGNDFASSYDLKIELDLAKMHHIEGASIYFQAKGTSGGEASDFDKEKIGALFKTNADAGLEEPIFVDKWWWRQRLFDDRIEFRLGRIGTDKDLIDVNKVAGNEDKQFLNAALVKNPIIPHKNGLGAYLNGWPTDWLYLRAAIVDPEARDRRTGFDTAFHGEDRVRFFGEVGLAPKFESANGKLPGHYRFGSWYNPTPLAVFQNPIEKAFSPRSRSGDAGFFFGCDQLVWKENAEPKDEQGLSVFARYGFGHGDVNKIEDFWSLGGQYAGLIPGRDKDTVGLGMAQAILSDQYGDNVHRRADRETVYELYYAYRVTPWCVLTPDLQFIVNAGGDKNDPDAFVAGLRLQVEF